MLLFRPFLSLIVTSEAIDSSQPNPLSRDMAIPCAQRCLASAVSLIDAIWFGYKENCEIFQVEPLPAWWFLVYSTYLSTVLPPQSNIYLLMVSFNVGITKWQVQVYITPALLLFLLDVSNLSEAVCLLLT